MPDAEIPQASRFYNSAPADVFFESTAVVASNVIIGRGVYIGHFSVIGSAPEDAQQRDTEVIISNRNAGAEIGDRTVIRDQCSIDSGKSTTTIVGMDCYIHSGTHVNHDCQLEFGVVLAPGVYLAGEVFVSRQAQIGMGSVIHQRRRIGAYSMIGMNSTVTHDIPPFALAYGSPCRVVGLNTVLLTRRGLDKDQIATLSELILNRSTVDLKLRVSLPEWIQAVLDLT